MAETKYITLEGLTRFKELLDLSYAAKFASKQTYESGGSSDTPADDPSPDDTTFASDEETESMLDDIFGF